VKKVNERFLDRNTNSRKRSSFGVTLIELMVVIVILGLLAGLIAPEVIDKIADAKIATAKTQIKHLHDAVRTYKIDTDEYPQELLDLIEDPGIEGWNKRGYLEGATEIPKDPWDNDYVYQCPGTRSPDFDIISYGRDGQEGGTEDDADIYNSELGKKGGG